ncbi:hypothetical protein HS041_33105 [Planomonospora sp. ID67723]|nr:hypothetical protein [Planomonospora sp. ID67723]MBG0832544.1 hypothetical protein [Planomonospora sp. ID67723]
MSVTMRTRAFLSIIKMISQLGDAAEPVINGREAPGKTAADQDPMP